MRGCKNSNRLCWNKMKWQWWGGELVVFALGNMESQDFWRSGCVSLVGLLSRLLKVSAMGDLTTFRIMGIEWVRSLGTWEELCFLYAKNQNPLMCCYGCRPDLSLLCSFCFKPQPFFSKPGMVAHIYNSTTQEAGAGGSDLRPPLII